MAHNTELMQFYTMTNLLNERFQEIPRISSFSILPVFEVCLNTNAKCQIGSIHLMFMTEIY